MISLFEKKCVEVNVVFSQKILVTLFSTWKIPLSMSFYGIHTSSAYICVNWQTVNIFQRMAVDDDEVVFSSIWYIFVYNITICDTPTHLDHPPR